MAKTKRWQQNPQLIIRRIKQQLPRCKNPRNFFHQRTAQITIAWQILRHRLIIKSRQKNMIKIAASKYKKAANKIFIPNLRPFFRSSGQPKQPASNRTQTSKARCLPS